jgi:hypothetical protein
MAASNSAGGPSFTAKSIRHYKTNRERTQHHQRERHIEQRKRGECGDGKRDRHRPLQRAFRHLDQRFHHQHQHRAFQAKEQRGHNRHIAQGCVDGGKRQHHRRAGQDEQQPRCQATTHAMHQPAEVGCQLLRLWPRQQHAEIKRMQETRIGYPMALFHHFAMHDRNLRCRPAEGQQTDAEPHAQRLGKARKGWRHCATPPQQG